MKHLLKLIILLFLFCGCADNSVEPIITPEETETIGTTKDFQRLMMIANNAANILDPSSRTSARHADPSGINMFTTSSSRGGETDTLLYMVNYADEKGFVIIGAPNGSPDFIGIVEEGSYSENLLDENPAFGAYIEATANEIKNKFRPINGDSVKPVDPIFPGGIPAATLLEIEEWDIYNQYGPYIELRWGQSGIEGSLCPNGIAGCVITATAQLLSWYEMPTWLHLTFPGRPFEYIGSQSYVANSDMPLTLIIHRLTVLELIQTPFSITWSTNFQIPSKVIQRTKELMGLQKSLKKNLV